MGRTWEQEKAYRERRSNHLGSVMDEAIANADVKAFEEAFTKSLGYMNKKRRGEYFKRFAVVYHSLRDNA